MRTGLLGLFLKPQSHMFRLFICVFLCNLILIIHTSNKQPTQILPALQNLSQQLQLLQPAAARVTAVQSTFQLYHSGSAHNRGSTAGCYAERYCRGCRGSAIRPRGKNPGTACPGLRGSGSRGWLPYTRRLRTFV